jgi:hypothetical protein
MASRGAHSASTDPSNPIASDGQGGFKKIIPADQSSGSIIAGLLLQGAELAKAVGTLSAESRGTARNRSPERAALFYATDYPETGRAVASCCSRDESKMQAKRWFRILDDHWPGPKQRLFVWRSTRHCGLFRRVPRVAWQDDQGRLLRLSNAKRWLEIMSRNCRAGRRSISIRPPSRYLQGVKHLSPCLRGRASSCQVAVLGDVIAGCQNSRKYAPGAQPVRRSKTGNIHPDIAPYPIARDATNCIGECKGEPFARSTRVP